MEKKNCLTCDFLNIDTMNCQVKKCNYQSTIPLHKIMSVAINDNLQCHEKMVLINGILQDQINTIEKKNLIAHITFNNRFLIQSKNIEMLNQQVTHLIQIVCDLQKDSIGETLQDKKDFKIYYFEKLNNLDFNVKTDINTLSKKIDDLETELAARIEQSESKINTLNVMYDKIIDGEMAPIQEDLVIIKEQITTVNKKINSLVDKRN